MSKIRPAMLTTFSVYNLARNNDFDCSKATQELGFACRPFDETIRDTVKWLIAEGKIEGTIEEKSGREFPREKYA